MAARKMLIRSRFGHVSFGEGFPGFGETDECKASRWNADLFEDAPISEPENAPVAYTDDDGFSTRGRYSGVGIVVDETGEFDPEPVRLGDAVFMPGNDAESVCRDSTDPSPVKSFEPACCEGSGTAATTSSSKSAVPESNPGSEQSI